MLPTQSRARAVAAFAVLACTMCGMLVRRCGAAVVGDMQMRGHGISGGGRIASAGGSLRRNGITPRKNCRMSLQHQRAERTVFCFWSLPAQAGIPVVTCGRDGI